MARKFSSKDWQRILADVRALIKPDDSHPADGRSQSAKPGAKPDAPAKEEHHAA